METATRFAAPPRVRDKRSNASRRLDVGRTNNGASVKGWDQVAAIRAWRDRRWDMGTVTIPKELASRDDLVVVPRKEYEALLRIRQLVEFSPTVAQQKALQRAEKNFRFKKTLSYDALTRELGFAH